MEAAPKSVVLALKDTLKSRDLETTVVRGLWPIEASNEEAARLLAALNFASAVRRTHGEESPACVWNNSAASSCIRVGASVQHTSPRAGSLTKASIDLGDGRAARILSVCH